MSSTRAISLSGVTLAAQCHTADMTIDQFLSGLVIAVVATVAGVFANWVKRPAWLPQWAVIVTLAVLVVSGAGLGYYFGNRDATSAPVITEPAPNSRVGMSTTLTGTLSDPLVEGHHLWSEIHAYDEANFHPAEKECPVIDGAWSCPALFVGAAKDPAGKRFVITVWDADAQADKDLRAYAQRPKIGPNVYDGMSAMPVGSRPVASVQVSRR